jgi:hypothetical protein
MVSRLVAQPVYPQLQKSPYGPHLRFVPQADRSRLPLAFATADHIGEDL